MQRVPPFAYSIFNVRYKTGRDYRVRPLNFFGTVRHFFEIVLSPKCPLFKFFDILQQTEVSKAQSVSPFYFFGTMRLFQYSHCCFFSKIFSNVSKGSPFNFFDILQQTGFSKSRKDPPFTILKTLRFLSLRYSADFRRSRLVILHFVST